MPDLLSWHASPFQCPDQALLSETLPTSLVRIAQRCPQRIAIRADNAHFTFSDLACRVAGLADEITRSSAPPGPVALIQSMGVDAVSAWFACAIAGRSFLLLEPAHPPARLRELIEAAAATLVVGDKTTLSKLPSDLSKGRLSPRGDLKPLHPCALLGVDDPAMIFPTSGSTGTPKLVTYSSRTLQVKVQSSRLLMKVPDSASVLIAGSHGNYGFLHHALVFLLSGGTLCLADAYAEGFRGIIGAITYNGARHVRFTPSLFRTVARQPEAREALRCLDAVRFSGEPLLKTDLELALRVLKPECLIQNVYGSTESTLFIWSKGDRVDETAGTVPIGRIYPLSSYALRPLEEGAGGSGEAELVLKSAFHALGDLRMGGIDVSRFPPDESDPTERIYETGDIVRRLHDGSLVMLGRRSRMVKIRGQRVFLTEVENQLRSMPGITGAAAAARIEGEDTVIYGFITHGADVVHPGDMRGWLANRLPDYMLPRDIRTVDQIPMLPGGKVDYQALIERVPVQLPVPATRMLHHDEQGRLAALWQSTLGWGAQDPEVDFFALGGDSLKLMQLTLALKREFGKSISVEAFLANPTLDGISAALGLTAPKEEATKTHSLTLRPFRNAVKQLSGVAMAMPGWHGSAVVSPFCEAGFHLDHEIWTANVSLESGNMLEKQRWWQAAQMIAARIRISGVPTPRILFGYSIGGSIAWIVGRLLAGTPHAPRFVIMVDAAPVHRLLGAGRPDIRRLTSGFTADVAPAVLHIRRAPVEQFDIGTRDWLPDENIVRTLEIPTVDHLEMGQVEVLRRAARWLNLVVGNYPDVAMTDAFTTRIETVGGHIYRSLYGGEKLAPAELDHLSRKFFERVGAGSSQLLLYLFLRDGSREQTRNFIAKYLRQNPSSRLFYYAKRRLSREPEYLCVSQAPFNAFNIIRRVDEILSSRYDCSTEPSATNRITQIIDIIGAVVDAAPARLMNKFRKRQVLIQRLWGQ